MKPYHLHVKRDDGLVGSIDALQDRDGYVVVVADGVRATSWSGVRDDIDGAVTLMTRMFIDKLAVT